MVMSALGLYNHLSCGIVVYQSRRLWMLMKRGNAMHGLGPCCGHTCDTDAFQFEIFAYLLFLSNFCCKVTPLCTNNQTNSACTDSSLLSP